MKHEERRASYYIYGCVPLHIPSFSFIIFVLCYFNIQNYSLLLVPHLSEDLG